MSAKKDQTDRVKVTCHCGASLMAPRRAVGKKVRCPRCRKVLTVPDPGSTVDRMLYALGDEEYNSPAVEPDTEMLEEISEHEQPAKHCPRCNAVLAPEAVFCVHCGFHLVKGIAAAAAAANQKSSGNNFFAKLFKRKK